MVFFFFFLSLQDPKQHPLSYLGKKKKDEEKSKVKWTKMLFGCLRAERAGHECFAARIIFLSRDYFIFFCSLRWNLNKVITTMMMFPIVLVEKKMKKKELSKWIRPSHNDHSYFFFFLVIIIIIVVVIDIISNIKFSLRFKPQSQLRREREKKWEEEEGEKNYLQKSLAFQIFVIERNFQSGLRSLWSPTDLIC